MKNKAIGVLMVMISIVMMMVAMLLFNEKDTCEVTFVHTETSSDFVKGDNNV